MRLNEAIDKMTEALVGKSCAGKTAVFTVAMGRISQAVGQKRANVIALKEQFALKAVKIKECDEMKAFELSTDIQI